MSWLQSDEGQLTQRWEVVARQLYTSGSSLYFPFFPLLDHTDFDITTK